MAFPNSFDIVSVIDFQEVDNAVNQAIKEIYQRYDLKGTKSGISLDKKEKKINLESKDDFHLKTILDILQNKMIKRGISLKALSAGIIEQTPSGAAKQEITLQQGIDKDNARLIVKIIKDSKLKVQAAIQDEQVRVSGKSKDDLQEVMGILKEKDLSFAIQFRNYR
jgi:uncharacterized protein YajQ (UPF0234 family)